MKYIKLIAIIGFCVSISGCAAIFNPYNSEFSCPETNKGACVSTTEAYKRSLSGEDETNLELCKDGKCEKVDKSSANGKVHEGMNGQSGAPESVYQKNLFRELTALIEEPETPIIAPPNVVRILLLSYTGEDNQFYGWRYVYFMDGSPKWVYGTFDRSRKNPGGM